MSLDKFIYDLYHHPEPKEEELDDEIDRLLLTKSVEEPNYLAKDQQDALSLLDSQVISFWLRRKFEPALVLMLLDSDDNYRLAKSELVLMERYRTHVEKWFRANFVARHAFRRIRELCFDDTDSLKLPKLIVNVKKTLTFLSNHLESNHPQTLTLQGTDAYTSADIALYNYLKRIVVGKYKDSGLKTHVRLCDPLVKFMSRFAAKNTHVIDVSVDDPLNDDCEKSSLLRDITKPAVVALGVMFFFLWRTS